MNEEDLKIVDEKITAILKEHNCTLSVNHVISINKIKPTEEEPVVEEKEDGHESN